MKMMGFIDAKVEQLRYKMDHGNKALQWLVPVRAALKKMGVGDYLRRNRLERSGQTIELREKYKAFCSQHTEELKKLSEMLEDDFSRFTLERVLKYRTTFDVNMLNGVRVLPQYFQKDIFGPVKDEVFVDGGAFVGDTIGSFLKDFAGGGV